MACENSIPHHHENQADEDSKVVHVSPNAYFYRPGNVCPKCDKGVLDYDGLLNVFCPVCGVVDGGSFT